MSNSQKEQGLDKPPRVHITTDVETYGALPIKEIPFIVGVLSNLSGTRVVTSELAQRKFLEFDSGKLDKLMSDEELDILPHLTLDKVSNELQSGGPDFKNVELDFRSMRDFEPGKVAEKFGPTRALLEERALLLRLRNNVAGRDAKTDLLDQAIQSSLNEKK